MDTASHHDALGAPACLGHTWKHNPQIGIGDLSKLILVRVDQQPEEGADATSDNETGVQSD